MVIQLADVDAIAIDKFWAQLHVIIVIVIVNFLFLVVIDQL